MKVLGATSNECKHAGTGIGKRINYLKRVLVDQKCTHIFKEIEYASDLRNRLSHEVSATLIWGRQAEGFQMAELASKFFQLFCDIPSAEISHYVSSVDWSKLKEPVNMSSDQMKLEVYYYYVSFFVNM
jgi:hypothetical protein